jgi:hypothetical protein
LRREGAVDLGCRGCRFAVLGRRGHSESEIQFT